VDVILQPAGQQSAEAYPNDAKDARILWQRPAPSLKTVETAERIWQLDKDEHCRQQLEVAIQPKPRVLCGKIKHRFKRRGRFFALSQRRRLEF
jgi:hypothetical protein